MWRLYMTRWRLTVVVFVGRSSDLTTHQLVHSGAREHECRLCDKKFGLSKDLARHVATVHEKLKPYKCSECEKEFGLKANLTRHQVVHSGAKPHKCSECGKTFAQSSTLYKHTLTHSGVKPHACGATFNLKRYLSAHIKRVHKNWIPKLMFVNIIKNTPIYSHTMDPAAP